MGLISKLLDTVFGLKIEKTNKLGQNMYLDVKTIFGSNEIKTIFDVGANQGQTVAHIRPIFPEAEIYSFEPGKDAFALLSERYGQNIKIYPQNIALGSKTEVLNLIRHQASVTDSFLSDIEEAKSYITKGMTVLGHEKTKVERLDNFCKQNLVKKIDLLKIDTQGFELNVLEGAGDMLNPKNIKAVITEVCFVNIYENQATLCEIKKLMSEHGYALVDFYNGSKSGGLTLKWGDLLFISNEYR